MANRTQTQEQVEAKRAHVLAAAERITRNIVLPGDLATVELNLGLLPLPKRQQAERALKERAAERKAQVAAVFEQAAKELTPALVRPAPSVNPAAADEARARREGLRAKIESGNVDPVESRWSIEGATATRKGIGGTRDETRSASEVQRVEISKQLAKAVGFQLKDLGMSGHERSEFVREVVDAAIKLRNGKSVKGSEFANAAGQLAQVIDPILDGEKLTPATWKSIKAAVSDAAEVEALNSGRSLTGKGREL